jgi:dihydroorotase
MGASTGPLLVDDATLVRFFEGTSALMGVHAEDEGVLERYRLEWGSRTPPTHHDARPAEAAVTAVRRLIELTRAHPRPVHVCHISTGAELEELEAVRGILPITTEVSPHHLWLTNDADLGNYGKVNPPLRPESDRRDLWAALKRGRLDTFGSDHAPHTREEKERPYAQAPSGIPGVETTLSLVLTAARQGRLSYERIAQMTAEAPATIFGFSRKGFLKPGFDADLVLVNDRELVRFAAANLLTRVQWSPFVGQTLAPKPDAVYVRGQLVAAAGAIVGDEARGRLVSPKPPAS